MKTMTSSCLKFFVLIYCPLLIVPLTNLGTNLLPEVMIELVKYGTLLQVTNYSLWKVIGRYFLVVLLSCSQSDLIGMLSMLLHLTIHMEIKLSQDRLVSLQFCALSCTLRLIYKM